MAESRVDCKTILVIEDDRDIREALKDAIEAEGYEVLTAENGREGLDRLRSATRPCLVLLDMMMPVMNGRQFLDEVMADAVLAPIPVFIVSAVADRSISHGAVGFIKKPVDLDLVLEMIERYCAKPG